MDDASVYYYWVDDGDYCDAHPQLCGHLLHHKRRLPARNLPAASR
jgi:hypothetical protein